MATEWDNEKKKISNFCAQIGKDSLLVQGAGGNVSFKDNDVLWIKASGFWLSQASETEIFLPVNLPDLKKEISKQNFSVTPQRLSETDLRPSIETLLHALMPQKIVVHLHAIEPLAYLVRKNAFELLSDVMLSTDNWIFVDYFKPGPDLAKAISRKLKRNPKAELVFMKNHGIVIGAETLPEVNAILKALIKRTISHQAVLDNAKPPPLDENLKKLRYFPCSDGGVNQLAIKAELIARLKHDWALYPDHLVFLGPQPTLLDKENMLDETIIEQKKPPFIFALGKGVYEYISVSSAQRVQIRCYFDVISRQKKFDKLVALNSSQISQILNWEAEHYRQNQNLKFD